MPNTSLAPRSDNRPREGLRWAKGKAPDVPAGILPVLIRLCAERAAE